MAFNLNQIVVSGEYQTKKEPVVVNPTKVNSDQLNKIELEYLLSFLKNADLKGYQIEMFYSLVVKLQNQYVLISK